MAGLVLWVVRVDPEPDPEDPDELGVEVPDETEAEVLAVASSSMAFLRLVTVHLEAVEVSLELTEAVSPSTDIAEDGLCGVIIQLPLVDPVELSL